MGIFQIYKNKRKRLIFMHENRMSMESFSGLIIHNLIVSEFSYLLRYLTDNRIERFNDFYLIHKNKNEILSAIEIELEKDVLKESEVFGYSREITEGNIKNLRAIIICICEYVDLCDSLNLELDPKQENKDFTRNLSTTVGGAMLAVSLAVLLFGTLKDTVSNDVLAFIAGGIGGLIGFFQDRLFGKKKREDNHD